MPFLSARRQIKLGFCVVGLLFSCMSGGCSDSMARQTLNKGYDALNARDYETANADANEFLRARPSGSGAAEAYYLKGRVEEQKAQDPNLSHTLADKRKYLDRARDQYELGLREYSPLSVQALLHTGIANVDFYEEDYAGAMRNWQSAFDSLDNDNTRAWVLYHIGRCQQRQGMFDRADTTFAQVRRDFPGSEAAVRAASRMGLTAFYVEVASFPETATAESAANALRAKGFPASRVVDAGRQVVQVGPVATYADAKAYQASLRPVYPGAIISP